MAWGVDKTDQHPKSLNHPKAAACARGPLHGSWVRIKFLEPPPLWPIKTFQDLSTPVA
jgi:hypothetical protein